MSSAALADHYFAFLSHLTPDSKLDLIARLSQSLKGMPVAAAPSLQSLYGAYRSEESAEELIGAIRTARVFNRDALAL